MSASLVGSEMCIRDSSLADPSGRPSGNTGISGRGIHGHGAAKAFLRHRDCASMRFVPRSWQKVVDVFMRPCP
eukprot:4459444-Alexandrium_andersonii.AAC.1